MTTQAELVEKVTKGKTMPSPKVMRKALVSALRSGQFKQTKNTLCKTDKYRHRNYCCLGVACKVAALAGYPIEEEPVHEDYRVRFNGELYFLPDSVKDVFGFSSGGGSYEKDGDSRSLQEDNDARGLNFSQIADIIESEPEGMFV